MKKKFYNMLCAASLLLSTSLSAQNEARFWYFGTNAGLDFSTNPPTALTNGAINAGEGSAVMTSPNGNLLFYTDGATVYNQNHAVMANGTGLMGDFSTTHSAIIIKQPASANLYYVFTLDDSGSNGFNGFNYSIVNMSLAAGLGSVTVKNAPLYASSTEKMAAVRHCNGSDAWVISHDLSTNVFRAYLLTSAGLSATPILSPSGAMLETIGQMKISPNGRKLAVAGFGLTGGFVLYDFDPATGTVSNPLSLAPSYYAYGIEFSPDGTKLYGTDHVSEELHQWDLCAGSDAAIIASKYTITAPGNSNYLSALQLAPNGKIYVVLKYKQVMSQINNPNAQGAACNYQHMSQSTAPKATGMGLPTFMSSLFKPAPPPFTYTASCQTMSFTAGPGSATACAASNFTLTGTQWQFGDPASGNGNTASGTAPVHIFSAPGVYQVKCIYQYQCSADTVLIPVTISNSSPTLNVAGNFNLCQGQAQTFTVSGASSYLWSNAATTNTVSLSPASTTVYSVTGTSSLSGCQSNKSFTVTVSICTGLADHADDHSLQIYPNPFNDQLHVESDGVLSLCITSLSGSTVLEQTLPAGDQNIDTSRLPAGYYLVTISNGQGKKTLRVVKTGE